MLLRDILYSPAVLVMGHVLAKQPLFDADNSAKHYSRPFFITCLENERHLRVINIGKWEVSRAISSHPIK